MLYSQLYLHGLVRNMVTVLLHGTMCVFFYSVERVYVDGLEVGNDECLVSEESTANEMKHFGVRGV